MPDDKKMGNEEVDYPETAYALCDECHEEFPVEELEECPSSWDEVKHGIVVHRRFCRECCEDIFESEGCQIDVDNCDRATEIMAEHIKKYAENKGFSLFKGKPRVYTDSFKIFCFADNGVSPEEIFEDKLVNLSDEHLELWEGKDTLLVKPFQKEISYSKEIVDEILAIFEELGSYKDGFYFLQNKRILVVTSDGMWGALALRSNEEDYVAERSAFIRDIEQGYKFFDISKKDGLVLVDTKKMEIKWSKLRDQDFVELCFDILKSLPRIVEVKITEGTSDLGQDIVAFEVISSLTGEIKRKCTIQCKHYSSRKVAPSDIAQILNSHSQLKFDVFCLMTSNLLFPSCRRMLEAWNSSQYPFKVLVWDVKKIEDYIRNRPQIWGLYFAK